MVFTTAPVDPWTAAGTLMGMAADEGSDVLHLTVDGASVEVPDDGGTLLDVLRGHLGNLSVKDGCSPQGQCGCCTVLVDGQPRVSCVTPARRVDGRTVTTLEGLDPAELTAWTDAFCATGGSQCGFCTPGIVVRFAGLRASAPEGSPPDRDRAARSLHAHLCRCTGWQTVLEAWDAYGTAPAATTGNPAAGRRAALEGRTQQVVGPEVVSGSGGFAADTVPEGALFAVSDGGGGWVVGSTLLEARLAAGRVQGRRTTVAAVPPLEAPDGEWDVVLRTSWVEPAYLETDASWCEPGGEASSPLANGGAFGAKLDSVAPVAARALADEHDVPVFAFAEDVAASGGYWLALAADEIYAAECSIIGSIGVVSGGFGFTGLIKRLGVERRVHTAGDKKAMLDSFQPQKPSDIKHLKSLLKDIHGNFEAMVRERRGNRLKGKKKELFSGAFWTGTRALEMGLIDGIGDLSGVMRDKFGNRVKLKRIDGRTPLWRRRFGFSAAFGGSPGLAPGLAAAPEDWAASAIAAIEERLIWNRFGL